MQKCFTFPVPGIGLLSDTSNSFKLSSIDLKSLLIFVSSKKAFIDSVGTYL
jgi:hypothetical protein